MSLSSEHKASETKMRNTYNSAAVSLLLSCVVVVSVVRSLPLPHSPPDVVAKHVLVIGCDGFGGMYMENATSFLPNLRHLITTGAYSFRVRDQMPSISAPNWGAIITGMGPEESGIPNNDWQPSWADPPDAVVEEMPPISGRKKIPETMWRAAKLQNPSLKIAVSESWDWIHYLTEPDIVNYEFRGHEDDDATAAAMVKFILQYQPNMMFIHFDEVDETGHQHGWGSPEYYNATRNADYRIGLLLDALRNAGIRNSTLVIVTADHGGYRKGHGLFDQCNMYIPGIFNGPGVMQGYNLTTLGTYISDKDFAPTALFAMGLHPGKFMVGRIVTEIWGN